MYNSGAGHQLLLKRCFKLEERSTGWEWAVLPCWQAESPQFFHFRGVCLPCKQVSVLHLLITWPVLHRILCLPCSLPWNYLYTSFTTTFTIQLPNYKYRTRIYYYMLWMYHIYICLYNFSFLLVCTYIC